MLSIAAAEFRMLLRNRLVALLGIVTPLALGAVLLLNEPSGDATGVIAVLQVVIMSAMGVYLTGTTTLAARRQTLFLKRLRSGAVRDGGILAGLVLPVVLLSTAQVTVVLAALGFLASPPTHPWLLGVAVVSAQLMFAGLALATAGATNSPEHAQVTTLPLLFTAIGAAFLVVTTDFEWLSWLKLALPGGAVAELTMLAWNGGELDGLAGMLAPSLIWAVVAVLAGRALLRWEPRV
ncbi:ABC transporter permease [Lysobacter korlensis]|uniref:ABC transporter permease n=1 Tax=Lysobacter korlensis TaxID=553636 RepID=A0ABV6RWE5_9GAMM